MDVHEAVGTATFDVAPLAVAVADNNASNLKKNNKKTSAKTTVKKIEHLTGIGCGAWLQLPVGGASSIVSVPGSGVHLLKKARTLQVWPVPRAMTFSQAALVCGSTAVTSGSISSSSPLSIHAMVKDAASGTREWWTWSNVEQQEQEVDVKPLSRTAVADSILAVFPLRRRRCADNSARVVVVHRDDRVSIAMADNLENVLSEKRIIGDDRNTGRCVDTLRIEHAHLDESHPRYATLSVVFSTTCENGFGWCSVRLYDNDRFQEAPRVFALDMNHPSVSATKYASTDRKLALCNAHDGILRVFESTDTAVSAVFALPLLPAVLGTNASSSTIAAAATSLKIALCWISPDYLATIVSVEVGGQRRTLLRVVNIAFHFVQCERPFAGFEGIEDDAVFEITTTAATDDSPETHLMVTAGNRLVIHSFEHREATLLDSLAHRGSPLTTVTQSFSSSANTSSHPLLALIDNVDITAVDFEKAYFASIASVPLCMDTVTPLVEAIIRRSFSTVASASPSAFWPRRVIDHLLRTFALSARHGNIMRTLLCRGDLPLLNTAVCHVQDFNEREIVAAMRFVMSGVQVEDLERDLAARQAELLGASVNDTTVDVFRFPFLDRQAVNATTLTGKMQTPAAAESATDYWLRLLIAYPCSDAMMVRALKSLTVVELGMVLSFIRRWFQWNHMTGTNVIRGQFQRLKQMIPAGTELPHKPLSIAQLVTFVGHLVDAHLSTIILTAALHETFLAVVEHARFEVRLCDETALLHNVLRDVYHVGDGANNGTETKGAAKKDSAGVPERKHTDRRAFITSKSSAADREANRSIGAYAMERTQWW